MKKNWANAINDKAKKQGNLLRNIRESAGLTMRQVAMQVGISHPAISQLEHGKLELPRSRVEQIVLVCGYKIEEFDRILGNGSVCPNYRTECESIIKTLDEETLHLLYRLLVRVGPRNGIGGSSISKGAT